MKTYIFDETHFILETATFQLKLDRQGNIHALKFKDAETPILGGHNQPIWRARQNNGLIIFSTEMDAPDYSWMQDTHTLSLTYTNREITVVVHFKLSENHVDLSADITRHQGDVIKYFFLPDRVEFPVSELNQFLYPKTWGISLSKEFFQSYKSYTSGYPGPMDFMHIDSTAGQLSFYGIQPIRDREPFDQHAPCLVPCRLYVGGIRRYGPPMGSLSHGWHVWIEAEQSFSTPVYRISGGDNWMSNVQQYGELNHITNSLEAKTGEMLETLKKSYIVKFEKPTWDAFSTTLNDLPAPAVIHFAGHLPNGFDRFYPKHLPFNPDMGDEQDFVTFCETARSLGHITMPYTNYTWWCYDTPYLEEFGEQALQKRLDGYPILEYYYEQMGYTVSQWSPIHQKIMLDEVEQQKAWGIDILSVDQMSARPFKPRFMTEDYWWDMNPDCPVPYGAAQGMADAAKRLHMLLPLSTEVWDNGPIDYLVNWCMQFCGYHIEGFDSSDIRFAPLIHTLAHDKTIFTWHDLAQETGVWNDYRLSLSLLLGFQLIYVEGGRGEAISAHRHLNTMYQNKHAQWPDSETKDWLEWLHQLSVEIVQFYIGEPLTAFTYISDDVLQATYGSVTITANLGQSAYALSDDIVISGHGFYAIHGDTVAGLLDRYFDRHGNRVQLLESGTSQ